MNVFLSLQGAYMERDSVYKFVRKLIALPYLPHEHIEATFATLKEKACDNLQPLVEYIETQWISSSTFPPKNWSIFMCATRTNNDVEGWHRRLNGKAGRGQLRLYSLVPLLHREAEMIPLQMKLISEKKLKRYVYYNVFLP